MREYPALYSFNRGLVSVLGLARTDQKRIALSAEVMTNWMPRVLGPMTLRPGLGYIGGIYANAPARVLPFVFATDDTALMEFTDATMRVWINDAILTRSSVGTTVTNGTFAGNITGWTDGSDAGASIAWDAGNYMKLTGTGTARAIGYQALSVAAQDQATEHGLRVVVARGPVTFRVGTSNGDDSLVTECSLDTGSFSFGFTPNAGTVYVQFQSTAAYKVQVQQCTIEAAGAVTLASPYKAADLGNLRRDQSGDTVFIACNGYQQRKVERRGTRPGARSWGVSLFRTDDGPFMTQNTTPCTLAASALTGDITVTASTPTFRSTHVGALFRIVSQVAGVSANIAAQNTFTSSLKVTGTGDARSITVTLSGTFSATVSLQVSSDNASWSDVPGEVWNGTVTGPYLDGLDGQTRYYRVGVETGNYTSGTVGASLTFTSGTLPGIVRVTGFTSPTSVSAQVVSDLGSTGATALWSEGYWSDYRGWPTSNRLHEGRLWWYGHDLIAGSVSDSYFSYNADVLGDSGPIVRTIGSGPVDVINWGLSLQRMVLGTQGSEISVRSSALDSPLTPTDFVLKVCSTQGSAAIEPVKANLDGFYVDRTAIKVFRLSFDLRNWLYPDYSSTDITAVVPEIGSPGFVRMALQQKFDVRLHCIRSDGTAAVCVFDTVEDVIAWVNVTTNGLIEDVAILPGLVNSTEDQVYYVVNRTINGASVRYLEKWALEVECRGTYSANASLNKQADAFIVFTNSSASSTVSGLGHLVGESVVCWADGKCMRDTSGNIASFTVSAGGTISLTNNGVAYSATTGVVGLAYTAQWQSAKLGMQPSPAASTLTLQKRVCKIGVVANWFHNRGLQFGADFADLDDMPLMESGTTVDPDQVWQEYDHQTILFPTTWGTDSRLCLQAQAPRPVTLLAAVVDMELQS